MSAAENRLIWLLGRHASSRVSEVTAREILDMHSAEQAAKIRRLGAHLANSDSPSARTVWEFYERCAREIEPKPRTTEG